METPVRILLECILVYFTIYLFSKKNWEDISPFCRATDTYPCYGPKVMSALELKDRVDPTLVLCCLCAVDSSRVFFQTFSLISGVTPASCVLNVSDSVCI